MTEYDLLVYGPIFCDLIFTGLPSMPILGEELFARDLTISLGGSAIVASGLHRLGAKVGLIADLGSDPISQILWQLLGDSGLDRSLITRHDQPLSQITVAMSFPEDRAFVTYFENPQHPPDIGLILQENPTRHLHICSFLAALTLPDLPQIAHERGITVSMDPGWDERALQDPRLIEQIADLDLFLPSQGELCHIAQEQDPDQAAQKVLSIMSPGVLVVKKGESGAVVYTGPGMEGVHQAAISVDPIDTTGAGDAFDAGFLYGYVHDQPLKTCLQYGTVCGGLVTTQPGGTEGFPTQKEMKEWLKKLQS